MEESQDDPKRNILVKAISLRKMARKERRSVWRHRDTTESQATEPRVTKAGRNGRVCPGPLEGIACACVHALRGQPPQLSLGHRALQFERGSLIWDPKSSPCWLLASLGSASSHGHEEHASLHLKTKLQTWVPGRTEAQALMTESTPYLSADTFSSGSEPEGSEP